MGEIGAPLVMPATGTGLGIVNMLAICLPLPSPRPVLPAEEEKPVSTLLGLGTS